MRRVTGFGKQLDEESVIVYIEDDECDHEYMMIMTPGEASRHRDLEINPEDL